LFTNVFPLTENGRVASPVETIAGASMPPIAAVEEATEDDAGAEETVAVLFENGALDEMMVGREEETASTVTVPVTIEQKLDAAASLSAGAAVVWDAATMALSPPAAEVTEATEATEATDVGGMVSVATTLPGTVAVAVIGIVTLAVKVAGVVAVAL